MSTKQKDNFLILIDGTAYLYRAFHALPPLTNKQGENTGAIHGFLKALFKIIEDFAPEHIGLIFDAKGKNFRHDIYSEYKANRSKMPDELSEQIPKLYEILELLGYPPIIIDGVEADDVIGTLSKQFRKTKDVRIFSGDKDFAQLVNSSVAIINPITLETMDEVAVKKKFGIDAKHIIDYLALVGDKSDNIPGLPGVGSKTASRLINQYGSVENIIKNKNLISGKVGETLKENIDQLKLSKILATIKEDLDLNINLKNLIKKDTDDDKIVKIFKRLELNSLLKNELGKNNHKENHAKDSKKIDTKNYNIITKENELLSIIEDIKKKKFFSFDLETSSLDYMEAKIVGISIALSDKKSYYIPIGHSSTIKYKQLSEKYVLDNLKPILQSEKLKKIGHNLKYDRNVLVNYNINLVGIEHDSMLLSYVYDSTAIRHGLDNAAEKYLSHKTIHYEDVAGKGAKQIPFADVDIDIAAEYACEDAVISLELYNYLWSKVSKDKNIVKVYSDIEMPLVPILSKIETNGVLIDSKALQKLSKDLDKELNEIESKCFKITNKEFNLNSPKQLQEILYDELKIPVSKKTPTGKPSTDEDTLQFLAQTNELPKLILEYRSLNKLKTGYTDKLPLQISKTSGRVHTSYQQAITSTGRLSSTDPNLQNIPIKTSRGRKIRKTFIAQGEKRIFAADYSQIELRIMAHLSEDKNLLKAFKNKIDIHSFTASEIFAIDIENVSTDDRRAAKAINFGLIYGMSAFGLTRQLGIPRNEAQAYLDTYFERYTGVKDYMDSTKELAKKNLFVETILGRKLHVATINDPNGLRRKAAERAAINAPLQGSAADIIKKAMIDVDQWIGVNNPDIKMIMQVHDELIFEVKKEFAVDALNEIVNLMECSVKLKIPLIVDANQGTNWNEAH